MHTSAAPPAFTALLFGLRGCLVDFGARTLPVTLQRLYPQHPADQSATLLAAHTVLPQLLGRTPHVNELHAFNHSLSETASEHAEATPGSTALLNDLRQQQVPCAWLDELPRDASIALAAALPDWLLGVSSVTSRPWPAPDACSHLHQQPGRGGRQPAIYQGRCSAGWRTRKGHALSSR